MRVVHALCLASASACLVLAVLGGTAPAAALGEGTHVEIRGVRLADRTEPHATARRRLAWEVRKRTSIETRLRPRAARLDDDFQRRKDQLHGRQNFVIGHGNTA